MDELSQQKVPFFFMVDFLMEKVEVFTENELSESSLLIDFEKFTNARLPHESNKILELHSFPQSKETYKKGFDVVQKNLKLSRGRAGFWENVAGADRERFDAG